MSNRFSRTPKHKRLRPVVSTCVLLLSACNSNFLTSTSNTHLQENVAQSFSHQYPHSRIEDIKKDNDAIIIHFKYDQSQCEACFSNEGKWIKTVTKLKWTSQLPPDIKKTFDRTPYASWLITGIFKFRFPNDSSYRFEINNGNLLDADHHDSFLKSCSLSITADGAVNVDSHQ